MRHRNADMNTNEIDNILARQSVELLDAMQRGEPDAAKNLAQWLKQSRRHTEHYLMTVAFERELNEVKFDPQIQLRSSSTQTNVIPLARDPARPAKNGGQAATVFPAVRGRTGKSAAAFAAAAMLFGILYWQTHRNVYETTVGEQRVIGLEDGSVVHLNTDSRVAVRFSGENRDIELLAGEALFKVHPDAVRPFRVHTPEAVIQAIGTEFNVYRQPGGTTVAVLEGRVKVTAEAAAASTAAKISGPSTAAASLGSGQQVRIDPRGIITAREHQDLANVAAWRRRQLIFAGTPLPQIVAEFNRYNRTPRFVIAMDNAQERTYSGVFDADDPQSLAQLLAREAELVIENQDREIVIRARAERR